MISRLEEPLEKVGGEPSDGESPVTTMLRAQLLDWACALDHELCFSTASKLFNEWMANPTLNPYAMDLCNFIHIEIMRLLVS